MDRKQARAFEEFVRESGDTLLRIATLLTSDRHAAEDVYQETLERLAARWAKVDNPGAFCRRVLHNIVVDRARSQQRRPRELGRTRRPTAATRGPATGWLRSSCGLPCWRRSARWRRSSGPSSSCVISMTAARPRSPPCSASRRARSRAPPRALSAASGPSRASPSCSPSPAARTPQAALTPALAPRKGSFSCPCFTSRRCAT